MLEHSQIRAGEWLGVYLSDEEPALEVVHLDAVIEGLRVTPAEPGKWRLSLPIPAASSMSPRASTKAVRPSRDSVTTSSVKSMRLMLVSALST